MGEHEVLAKLIQNYGLGIVLTAVGALLLITLIKFFLNQWDKMLLRQEEQIKAATVERERFYSLIDTERKSFVGVLGSLDEQIKGHVIEARDRGQRVDEAHKYQREEHKDQIGIMTKMCHNIEIGNTNMTNAIQMFKSSHDQRASETKAILGATDALMRNCQECSKTLVKLNGKA